MFCEGARMTAGKKSWTAAGDRWTEHIRREFDAFEQRELMFLARERDDRLREIANRLKLDLAAIKDKNFTA
jgi:hypothetical protein